jgi:sterol desaturase/sphingolipid hydroxylase (fatty acid hydroxylase superfamily)
MIVAIREYMFTEFFYSTSIILGIFGLSTFSAYGICKFYNYPFINPSFTQPQIVNRLVDIVQTTSITLFQSVGVIMLLFTRLLPNSRHNGIQTAEHIILYIVLVEFFYYSYHRFIHKFYYKEVHKKHHANVDIYPFDTFYLTYYDTLGLITSLSLPIIILRPTFFELCFVLYLYITSSYLSHSKLLYTHHSIHHTLLIYNYCILFPIFDVLFGTYREK